MMFFCNKALVYARHCNGRIAYKLSYRFDYYDGTDRMLPIA